MLVSTKVIRLKAILLLVSIVCSLVLCIPSMAANTLTFESGTKRVTLLELYSSQGCSSCPPAEKWINQFTQSERLWVDQIPVVFHVDYWNYLGWKDPFSDKRFSARQRQFQEQGLSHSVYTPGFILNGNEWRGWFKRRNIPKTSGSAGNLRVTMQGPEFQANYSRIETDHVLNVALLGFGLKTKVKRGENRRRILMQDFVVLEYKQLEAVNNAFTSHLSVKETNATRLGLAVWISKGDSLVPEQAAGNWLPANVFRQ